MFIEAHEDCFKITLEMSETFIFYLITATYCICFFNLTESLLTRLLRIPSFYDVTKGVICIDRCRYTICDLYTMQTFYQEVWGCGELNI